MSTATRNNTQQVLESYFAWGFDSSKVVRASEFPFKNVIRIRCSQCAAMGINGHATHETGCPNIRHECKGCGEIISYKGYCADCS